MASLPGGGGRGSHGARENEQDAKRGDGEQDANPWGLPSNGSVSAELRSNGSCWRPWDPDLTSAHKLANTQLHIFNGVADLVSLKKEIMVVELPPAVTENAKPRKKDEILQGASYYDAMKYIGLK